MNPKATAKSGVTIALLVALSGCSLVMSGSSQQVTFTSEPPGSSFTVAGQTATTPATLDLPKDDYQIVFHHNGYEESSFELKRKLCAWFYGSIAMGLISSSVDMISGAWKEFESTDVHVVLQPLPDTVQELSVTVTSDPPGADILIANRSYGVTPKELRLSWPPDEREKEVTLTLRGHLPKKVALLRTEKQLSGVLEKIPVPVTVRIASKPSGAEVRVDGRPQGKTPIPVELIWAKDDKPRGVELSLAGYVTEKRELTRESGDLSVDLKEAVEEILLPLKIEPAGAKILVDGVALPDGAKQVKLSWSISKTSHSLIISQPGYSTKPVEVKRADAAKILEVRLAPALPGNP